MFFCRTTHCGKFICFKIISNTKKRKMKIKKRKCLIWLRCGCGAVCTNFYFLQTGCTKTENFSLYGKHKCCCCGWRLVLMIRDRLLSYTTTHRILISHCMHAYHHSRMADKYYVFTTEKYKSKLKTRSLFP